MVAGDGRNRTIDGLRGYLALGVLCSHFVVNWNFTRTATWSEPDITVFRNMGPVAVAMFFMITAFLFYGKIVRQRGKLSWHAIFLGRILRLTPMYVVSVLLMFLIVGWHTEFTLAVPVSDILKSAARWLSFTLFGAPDLNGFPNTYTIFAGVTWTLRYEWVFYFFLPVVALAFRIAGASKTARIAVLLAVLLTVFGAPAVRIGFVDTKLCAPFILGMLVYECFQGRRLAVFASSRAASVVVAILIAASLLFPWDSFGVAQTSLAAGAFLLIAAGTPLFGLLRHPASIALGDASYSIYLLHGAILHLMFQFALRSTWNLDSSAIWLLLPVAVAVASLVSLITYRYVEKPFMLMGKGPKSIARGQVQAVAP